MNLPSIPYLILWQTLRFTVTTPAHQEVAAFIGKVVKERAVVDYKI
jgi:hypothetical protein